LEEKNAEYFNMIQPYQHHTRIPKTGIYCYSFSLYPEKEFLSGYYNAALVKTNITMQLNNNIKNDMNDYLTKIGRQPYEFSYIINIYAKNYNMFEIVGSQVGMKFSIST
jgi:hypothetical protein